jgi:hypothetical protein
MTGPVIVEKAESFYGEISVTDKCTFSEGNNKKITVRTYVSRGTVSCI